VSGGAALRLVAPRHVWKGCCLLLTRRLAPEPINISSLGCNGKLCGDRAAL